MGGVGGAVALLPLDICMFAGTRLPTVAGVRSNKCLTTE